MKPEELKPFVDFMEEHGLLILSAEGPDFRIYLAGKGAENLVSPSSVVPETPADKKRVIVTSPLVGTFYRAPASGAASFVEAGQEIKVGDILCIVEAMKVMNHVKSEVAGKVLEIKKENGKPVEFGEPLFIIAVV
ncbi:MAG: acetyl-CoA carboxylase biotin carboxyl carrier protein [Candidatus Omnitrophota bacterium]